eukprot:CAMPEP_0178540134 /NCGR_PEP_ID=MMETSP0697-20121206/873_1 /TAXON_ID=265572 /ORGANISM="Extubocellulus spinifer, Strain CCMP396" /LENGTH=155 /DNA_ID=CAMNT_0020172467 /DNA_START=164 /DNA_END=632 /DNA_ORIENTATION=-
MDFSQKPCHKPKEKSHYFFRRMDRVTGLDSLRTRLALAELNPGDPFSGWSLVHLADYIVYGGSEHDDGTPAPCRLLIPGTVGTYWQGKLYCNKVVHGVQVSMPLASVVMLAARFMGLVPLYQGNPPAELGFTTPQSMRLLTCVMVGSMAATTLTA